jgi:hypothetical protein
LDWLSIISFWRWIYLFAPIISPRRQATQQALVNGSFGGSDLHHLAVKGCPADPFGLGDRLADRVVLSLSGFASAKSGRIVDPVATEIAADLTAPVSVVAPL